MKISARFGKNRSKIIFPLDPEQKVLEYRSLDNPTLFAGITVHVRDLQLQGEEVRPVRDDAARRLHGRLHRASRR